jgi:FkbM family methyltransferase
LKQFDDAYRSGSLTGAKKLIAAALRFGPLNSLVLGAARAILPPRVHHRFPVARRSIEYRLFGGGSVTLLRPDRDQLARDIYWGGGRPTSAAEQHKLRCFEELCRDTATFIDIGAYTGFFCLVAARANPAIRALAFEIVPENFLALIRNVVENDMVGSIAAKLVGLGAENSHLRVPPSLELVSLESSVSLSARFTKGVEIPIRTLDEQCLSCGAPFLLKIDVEGFEPQVLRGAAKMIRKHRPDMICEVLPDVNTAEPLNGLLKPLGYRFFEFTDDGPLEHPKVEVRAVMRDWLFTARDWAAK